MLTFKYRYTFYLFFFVKESSCVYIFEKKNIEEKIKYNLEKILLLIYLEKKTTSCHLILVECTNNIRNAKYSTVLTTTMTKKECNKTVGIRIRITIR